MAPIFSFQAPCERIIFHCILPLCSRFRELSERRTERRRRKTANPHFSSAAVEERRRQETERKKKKTTISDGKNKVIVTTLRNRLCITQLWLTLDGESVPIANMPKSTFQAELKEELKQQAEKLRTEKAELLRKHEEVSFTYRCRFWMTADAARKRFFPQLYVRARPSVLVIECSRMT